MCPPLSLTVSISSFCHGRSMKKAVSQITEGCVRGNLVTFFLENLVSTKSRCGHDAKIVRFLGHPLFLHVNSVFFALERNMHQFLTIFVQHGDGQRVVPEGTTSSPKLTPPPTAPK